MTRPHRSPAALAATLAAVLTLSACGHLQRDAEESLQVVELDPSIIRIDEADIASAGPEQIEDAIDLLDAQRGPRLVSELSTDQEPGVEAPADLLERIRQGFAVQDVDHPTVDREVDWFARHPDYLDRTFKRGERYLHHIVEELQARNMPLELALLPVVESAFNPIAYSHARAAGLWQFIPATGQRYGMKQNWYYDGRRDVLASTTGALDYLQFLANEFNGDWLLAIAAYNSGEARVAREVKRNQAAGRSIDFFSLSLPRETSAYVPKLLAISRIVADPASHGLNFAAMANEPYFAKVEVGGQLDLQVAAELAGIPKEELLALNPAFNHWVTDPDGPHHLLVPVEHHERFASGITALPPEKRVRVVYHRVRRGDTLGAIATRYGVSVGSLQAANKIRGSLIHPGQDLLVTAAPRGVEPTPGGLNAARNDATRTASASARRHVVRRGETLWSIAKRHGIGMNQLASSNGLSTQSTLAVGKVLSVPGTARLAATGNAVPTARSTTYVIRRGDTLSTIAGRFRVRLNDLLSWNNLSTRSVIKPGQKLVMYVDNRRAST